MFKLVRDLIPHVIPSDKLSLYNFSIANEHEYSCYLEDKLLEEVNEYIEDKNEEELADILEVIDAIIVNKGFNKERILLIKEYKKIKRGGFEKRIIMETK